MKTREEDRLFIPQNLISPPAAQTATSIALIWDKPEGWLDIEIYQIYMDGQLHGISHSTDYTAERLKPAREYTFCVKAILKNGTISSDSKAIHVMTKMKSEVCSIFSFNAIGDGVTKNTKAIQQAICACADGGTVYIPQGIFLTGAIFLKSNMTLYVEKGGVLLGSSDTADYPLMQYRFEGRETTCYASLINTESMDGKRHHHITISGPGKVDANGSALRKKEVEENHGKPGRAICLRNTDEVYLKDITVRQSPAWCVHLIYCNQVSVNNIEIHTRYDENGMRYEGIRNGDGLDPDSCKDVFIFHTTIASQDDCIAIKSGKDEEGRTIGLSSERIRITNCHFKSGFGVVAGSEMSGDIRDVLVQDCDFEDAYSIGSIKTPRGRGGIVERITYENCTLRNYNRELSDCEWFRGAIYIDQFYSHVVFDLSQQEPVSAGTPQIRNITFRNIYLDTLTGNAIYLTGLPESPLRDIKLEHVVAIGKYGLKANNIDGLNMEHVLVVSREDEDYTYHQVKKIK